MTPKSFDDLTKIDCPFGELDKPTAARLFLAWRDGAEVQCHFVAHEWAKLANPAWAPGALYRLAPPPVTPDYIDWSQVADRFMCMATDGDGETWCFNERPVWHEVPKAWLLFSETGDRVRADAYSSFRRGTVAPEDSLQFRPGCEPK